ncbi:MAG: endopeptidase La [Deltaproteobacteria bacterium RIFOXYA12_FULL_58_15]|nr:MAG: endopeptidase La [Deltaproteobacteria bacterium RIFOXYA12_FULL_58_15]
MSDEKKKDDEEQVEGLGNLEQALARTTEGDNMIVIPEELPVLTLRNTVLFPGSIVPLGIGRPKTVRLVEESIKDNGLVAVVAQRDPDVDDPVPADLYGLGCAARLVKLVKASKDNFSVVVQGLSRVRLTEYSQSLPYLKARIHAVDDSSTNVVEVEALTMSLKKTAREVLRLIPELPPSAAELLERVDDAGVLADLIASNVEASVDEKQSVLETFDLVQRMRRVLELLSRQLEVLKLSNKISSQVKGEMSKTQREYYLRQQLKAIKDELGEGEDTDDDLAELEARVNEAQLPDEAEKAARKELRRLRNMSPSQAEYTVARTYVEWLCDLPWGKSSIDKIDLKEVREILDADHYGLEKPKKRMVEFLAVRKLKSDMKGPILCFVGPPGTGKTSLAMSIARAMGRKFVRVAMGGVRDEAEIRGHRRTYVGALPGRIIQGLKKGSTDNPVFVLDEVDKLAHDFRGDPAAALLEVLDPEQNHTFQDHYIDCAFDLSKCFFIATANVLDTVPWALRDRMEVLELPGYTQEEKLEIALRHLLPKALEEHGLDQEKCEITPDTLKALAASYTREAGVRNLKREIDGVCRSVAVQFAEGNVESKVVEPADLDNILGPEKFVNEMSERTDVSGVATGLAWTSVGGDILFIEATKMPGKGGLTLTGQLGDVMKESATAALSYIRSNAAALGIADDDFKKFDLHVHVPAGSIPKDGPSAGVTMLTALVSLLTGINVRADVAMTGEITLRGKVLPVGGIKEKVLAARRAGVTRIVMPERNRKDLVEIPEENRKELEFMFAQTMEEALKYTLVRQPEPLKPGDVKAPMPESSVPIN